MHSSYLPCGLAQTLFEEMISSHFCAVDMKQRATIKLQAYSIAAIKLQACGAKKGNMFFSGFFCAICFPNDNL